LQQDLINNLRSHKKIKQNVTVNFRAPLRSLLNKVVRFERVALVLVVKLMLLVGECKNNIVWREYDKNIVFIWSNGSKKLSHGGKGFTFPIVNATVSPRLIVLGWHPCAGPTSLSVTAKRFVLIPFYKDYLVFESLYLCP
jgi:hypothetical protein